MNRAAFEGQRFDREGQRFDREGKRPDREGFAGRDFRRSRMRDGAPSLDPAGAP